jgi:predicted acetyltransferase
MMESKLLLSKPTFDLKEEYLSFYHEWKKSEEEMVPWVISKNPSNFEKMLQFLYESENNIDIPEGWVPTSTYWLINENKRVLGAVNIRHKLTEGLLERGGHIGYGIRPSERRKGYATKLLELSLEKVRQLGIQKALVTCDGNNIGSLKTILNNGGVLDTDFIEENGTLVKRFWIDL